MTRKLIVQDPTAGKWLGIAVTVAGAVLLWDAYEKRGRKRPFLLKWIPGG
jgi:hypothetical protein